MAAPANHALKLPNKPSEDREEGELSSSDDRDTPSGYGEPSAKAAVRPAVMEPQLGASQRKVPGGIETGSRHLKIIDKDTDPFKPDTPRQFQHSGTDLVIRFSDTDSVSDFGESGQEKTAETPGVTRYKKLPSPTNQSISDTKPVPMKMPLNHTGSSVSQGFRVRNVKILNKNKYASQPKRPSPLGMHLNSSKILDLRQQIAMRKREQMLRPAWQSEERGSNKDESVPNSKDGSQGKPRPISRGSQLLDPEESAWKRRNVIDLWEPPPSNPAAASKGLSIGNKSVKEGDNSSVKLNLNVFEDFSTAKSMETTQASVLQGNVFQEKNLYHHDSYPIGMPMPSRFIGSLPTRVDESGHTVASHGSSKRKSMHFDPLMQCWADFGNVPSGNLIGSTHLDAASSGMNVGSLAQLDETHDRELDAAQEQRRSCELVESESLKAYHLAQRALIQANSRCTYLYNQRFKLI